MRSLAGLFVITLLLSVAEISAFLVLIVFIANLLQAKKGLHPVTLRELLRALPWPLMAGIPLMVLSGNFGLATMLWLVDRVGPRAVAILPATLGGIFTGVMLTTLGAINVGNRSR